MRLAPSLSFQLLLDAGALHQQGLHRAIGIVHGFVADQRACIGGAVVGDGHASVRSHNLQVEIDQPLAGDVSAPRSHAVRGMTGGTSEAGVDVAGVLSPTRILDDLVRQIMALAAHRIGAIDAEIGRGIEVRNALPGARRLTEFVAALQQMVPFRPVWSARTCAAEFAIVVAVVAVRAVNLHAHGPALRAPIQLPHISQQAGLWQTTAAGMQHGVA